MKQAPLPKWLVWRDGVIHYARRVPKKYEAVDPRGLVLITTGTADLRKALAARDVINSNLEDHWQRLFRGEGDSARDRYQATIDYARAAGFEYVASDAVASSEQIGDLVQMLRGWIDHASQLGPQASPTEVEMATDALVGLADDPGICLSNLLESYEQLTADERRGMSEHQLHKWRLPRKRAIANFISVVGDKGLTDVSRADAVTFRGWWSDRLQDDERPLKPATANKDITCLSSMSTKVSDIYHLDLPPLFQRLRFKMRKEKPPPYSTEFIQTKILAPGALDGLNPEARAIVMMMIETGARPIELAHLRPDLDIKLDDAVPHISIAPQSDYALKTAYSERQLPLVGIALDGARLFASLATHRYRGNNDTLSATVGKYLSTNGLRETERHTLYSLRHAFKDRLTDVSAPDIIDSSLMGHMFSRPDYGRGPTLERKLEWISKIAVSV